MYNAQRKTFGNFFGTDVHSSSNRPVHGARKPPRRARTLSLCPSLKQSRNSPDAPPWRVHFSRV
ncbi:hypothetical protein RHCRD62_90216 [Rhodococcus sp. RD6.2]|nr:hypothetical protein RHCRD62_90216 [Rhodococcus sp. RD6.2]